ncbi:uncharacterized protein LOC105663148 [Megachile rotundata]|uniref:uncharacterized protein LOC105663148 n=1 Tax=Megachile rotundata TaxID=143995 RepID=UPI00061535E6|nr:PREDICTED: uncharacterized protein LOC105663148 [Megachile rotundata]
MDWFENIGHGERGRLLLCLLVVCALSRVSSVDTNDTKDVWNGFSSGCADAKNLSVSCYGVRIVRKIVQQLLEKSSQEPNIEIFDGVSLVEVPNSGPTRKGRLMKGFGNMGSLVQFLEGRELRIKLPSFLPQNIESALQESLPADQGRGGGGGGGFGGGGGGGGGGGKKGGGNGMMILALMMGKMMAALGFGALGLLAMKALMVSALALMLSLIVAVKKLASGHDSGGGHHVVYAQDVGHHHYRKKRSLGEEDLPYRGYAHLFGDSRVF